MQTQAVLVKSASVDRPDRGHLNPRYGAQA